MIFFIAFFIDLNMPECSIRSSISCWILKYCKFEHNKIQRERIKAVDVFISTNCSQNSDEVYNRKSNMTQYQAMTLKMRFIGFIFGAVLSYLCFFMMVTQMDISLSMAIWLSSIISLYLCFGLAYSKNVQ